MKCPKCNSRKVKKEILYADNGVYGPGFHRWPTGTVKRCKKCDHVFA